MFNFNRCNTKYTNYIKKQKKNFPEKAKELTELSNMIYVFSWADVFRSYVKSCNFIFASKPLYFDSILGIIDGSALKKQNKK